MSIVRESGGLWLGNLGRSDGSFLCIEDLLRGARRTQGQLGSATGSTVFGVMANLSTVETAFFPHALHLFLWGELLQFYKVYFHDIGVLSGSGCGGWLGSEAVVASSPMKFINMELVTMEDFSFLYPFLKDVW